MPLLAERIIETPPCDLSQANSAPSPQPERRVSALDSLRGLAALTVVFHHLGLLLDFPKNTFGSFIIHDSPFRIFFSGHMAVLLFFVLSGFALSMMLKSRMSYPAYLVRRVFRIMLPVAAMLVLSATLYFVLKPGPVEGIPDWANGMIWTKPVTVSLFLRHLFLFGLNPDVSMDTALWSLVYEMRISVIFPVLYFLCRKNLWSMMLASCALYYVMGLAMIEQNISLYVGDNAWQSLVLTLYYLPFFVFGYGIFFFREAITDKLSRFNAVQTAALSILVFILLIDKHDILTGLGAIGLMALALGNARFGSFLHWGPFRFLGRISYSLYLTHMLVMGSVIQILHVKVGYLALAVLILSPIVAYLFFVFTEQPAILLGRKYALKFDENHKGSKALAS